MDMMQNICINARFLCVLGLLCVLGISSCSDDEKTNPMRMKSDNARPTWTVPDDLYKTFGSTMAVQVTVQDELMPYVSDDDLMCATINGEIRAVSGLLRTLDEVCFSLVIAGDAGDSNNGKVSLSYYCSQLKRIYTVSDWKPFTPGLSPMQDGKPYVVRFITE